MKLILGLLITTFVSSSAFAAKDTSVELIEKLKKELPVGTYVGKTHSRGECTVAVSTSETEEDTSEIYAVKVTYAKTGVSREFEIYEAGENLTKVASRDLITEDYRTNHNAYVGNSNRDPRTAVGVGRGRIIKDPEGTWVGWEKELLLNIIDLSQRESRPKKKWRVSVGAMNAKSIGFGFLSCEIDPLN